MNLPPIISFISLKSKWPVIWLVVAYVISGKLRTLLAIDPGYAAPLFLPAGIAVAAVFLGGMRMLPGVFAGAAILNLWVGLDAPDPVYWRVAAGAILIALASTLQAGVGGLVFRRLAERNDLTQGTARPSLLTVLLLTPLICLIGSSLAVSALWAIGSIESTSVLTNGFYWWTGDMLGVVVMFPLALTTLSGPRKQCSKRAFTISLPVLLVLVSGLVGLYFMQNAALNNAQLRHADEFGKQSQKIRLRIEQRLSAYEQVLRGLRGLEAASNSLTRQQFNAYVSALNLGQHYPGFQVVGYAPWVSQQNAAGLAKSIHQSGFPAFEIHPPGNRAQYAPIVYLEPFSDRNLRAFGYDMYAEPIRRAAMDQARDINQVVMSGKVRLVQENGQQEQSGVLMFLPEYHHGKVPKTIQERRLQLTGWVYAAFRMNDLMNGLLSDQQDDFGLAIFDGTTPAAEDLLFQSDAARSEANKAVFDYTRTLEIAHRTWTIQIVSLPAFDQQLDTRSVDLIRFGGLGTTLLLALMVWQLASGRERALKLAENMTREMKQKKQQLVEAQRIAHVGSWERDLREGALDWSDELYQILALDPQAAGSIHAQLLRRVHPDDRRMVTEAFQRLEQDGIPFHLEHRLLLPGDVVKYVRQTGEQLIDDEGVALKIIGTLQDITPQKQAQAAVERLAHYDTLTQLPNRSLFFDRLRMALIQSKRNKTALALFYMDLDGFKQVNDSLGHRAGDLLLIAVAKRLTQTVRASDTVARLGGDEFTVILPDLSRPEDAIKVAENIIQSIGQPFMIEARDVEIGISIGIAQCLEKRLTEDELVQLADQAMYEAKQAGKNTYRVRGGGNPPH
ncbi:CHASE domain-containing protein [Halothiobacillus sp.]|uniref:CHASE domain-containing protein n=1 Tax=Halothiobacillus sp. TaxID=1891311 RepID=UPI002608AAF2|nr:CHASE domain-containing protein [Halothiobacillus sp.]